MHPSREKLLELGRARVEYKRIPLHMEAVDDHCHECEECAEIVVAETTREREEVEFAWECAEHEESAEARRIVLDALISLIGETAAYEAYDTHSDLELEKMLSERRMSGATPMASRRQPGRSQHLARLASQG